MRRTIISAAALVAALLAAPAVASAHHVDNQTATCALVGNVPTITAAVDFVGFGSMDTDVHVTVGVDSTVPIDVHLPYAPPSGHWSQTTTATPGAHRIYVYITWMHNGDDYDSSFHTTVNCPTPVPPPPPPPVTPPPPPVVCGPGTTAMPGPGGAIVCLTPKPKPKPCPCRPKPRPKPHRVSCKIGYFNHDPLPGDTRPWAHASSAGCRIRVVHPHLTHGRQVFVVSCPGGARSVRWWVDGKRVRNHHWTHTTHGGLHLSSYLFDQKVWGHWLWGHHVVSASVRARPAARVMRSSWSGDDV